MESRKHHRVPLWIVLTVLAPLLSVTSAKAEHGFEDPVDTWVTTGSDEVVVEAETTRHEPGAGGAGDQASGSGPSCYLREIPTSEWDEDMSMMFFYHRMRKAPYRIVCDGEERGVVWNEIDVTDPGPSGPRVEPRDIAMRLRDELPIPGATVAINPRRGLAGSESWFWIAGYTGAALTNSTDAFGDLIEVEARVTHYEWSFGDGATVASESPGRPYPDRSEVRHVYERSSAGFPDGYPVDVTFTFAVRYRVDGGAWTSLPGITRQAHTDYRVRESQAVIQR